MKRLNKLVTLILLTVLLLSQINTRSVAMTSNSKYMILIADKNGKYTFYDINDSTDGTATIEVTETGVVMVPLKKLVKLLSDLTYQYDSVNKKATVENIVTGRRLVYSRDSNRIIYYAGPNSKGSKIKISYKVYKSETSSSIMVPMDTLRLLLQEVKGYHYYDITEMQSCGYDTYTYSGLILYNPYQAATELPKATKVIGISSTVKVTIPEGYSVSQIFDLLVRKGVCASTDLLYYAMAEYDFSYYPLVSEIPENEYRCFQLEGYLYPDTYEFFRLMKGEDVIGRFLRNAEKRITEDDRNKAKEMGYSVYELLTIASLIEKETGDYSLMPRIASVIYNRLNISMKLQFDSSINYVERYVKPYISGDIDRFNSYYNTYKCPTLPAGPICNPGRVAIEAALNPEITEFLYFYSDIDGKYYFNKDYVKPENKVNPGDDVDLEDQEDNLEDDVVSQGQSGSSGNDVIPENPGVTP